MRRDGKNKKNKLIRILSLLLLLMALTLLVLPKNIYVRYPSATTTSEEPGGILTLTIAPKPTSTPAITTSNDIINSYLTKEELYLLNAYTVIDTSILGNNYVNNTFYSMKLDDTVINRIYGKSYKDNSNITYDNLRYVRVLHYDFTGQIRIGELIVNEDIATDIVDIFYELYEAKYPIQKMVLIDEYNSDDNNSMADNNTSAFNYREITGSSSLSRHSMGLAIDINPLYNPILK